RAAGAPHRPNHFAAGHWLPHTNTYLRHVAITGCNPVAVVYHHDVAVTAVHTGEDDPSISRGFNRGAVIGRDIQTRVVFKPASTEWIAAISETVSDVSAD